MSKIERGKGHPPRWLFIILAVGGLVACGIYIGMIRAGMNTTPNIFRAAAFGLCGLLMLWRALAVCDS